MTQFKLSTHFLAEARDIANVSVNGVSSDNCGTMYPYVQVGGEPRIILSCHVQLYRREYGGGPVRYRYRYRHR